MADEFQMGSGNWWESTRSSTTSTTTAGTSSSRRFDTSTGGPSPPSSTPMNSSTSNSNNYGWPTSQIVEPPRPTSNNSNDSSSATAAAATSILFQTDHTHSKHLQQQQQQQHPHAAATSLLLSDPNIHMMGLGLSSQHPMDHWNQPNLSFRSGEKGDESSFRTMLQEDNLSSNTAPSFQQTEQWPRSLPHNKMLMYSSGTNSEQDSSRGGGRFSLDQSHLISNTILSNQHQHHNLSQSTEDSNISFHQMDSSSSVHHYQNNPPRTNLLPGLLGYEMNQQSNFDSARPALMHTTNYNSYPSSYSINTNTSSSPVDHHHHQQQQQQQQPAAVTFQQPNSNAWSSLSTSKPSQAQLHFSNNAPFWNASNTAAVLPLLQMQSPSSTIDEKPKKSTSSSEASTKRPRNEPSSALPAFKVRKEKMGDRITALQQIVSPFGKTDTASVLSEAIEYIKFLHQQVSVLSDPYMKSGAPIQQQQQQGSDHKSKDQEEKKQDLRGRGLCLVPVSSTFPVTHETTVDFWNPTFGGTFR